MKLGLKEKAINLREKGFSYSEILNDVSVSKSTLSLWLRSVNLSKKQKQKLTAKKLEAISRGWETRRQQRKNKIIEIKKQVQKEINFINKKYIWFMGIMLYWAEGAKQKDHNVSQGVLFSNSDPIMIRFFLKWLKECLHISHEKICFDIYIHKNHNGDKSQIIEYWANKTGFSHMNFGKIYYKKEKVATNRRNIGYNYYGQLRVKVKKSTDLNRKIAAWVEAICYQCGIV